MSALWSSLATSLGTKIKHMAAYNPEANGMIEQFHCPLKAVLKTKCQDRRWRKELPWILLGLRTVPHAAFSTSPVEALYRQSIAIKADVFQKTTGPTTPTDVCRALNKSCQKKEWAEIKYVFIRTDPHWHHLSPFYSGPHQILQPETSANRCQWTRELPRSQ
ncbi:uncharacterized protein [Macrobrachium rosenbergii]|uniref:uncharacterized protein n=1 Tax=Macrobrachium rosenbergii TaxID=79674 RepID=UPI0034D779DF